MRSSSPVVAGAGAAITGGRERTGTMRERGEISGRVGEGREKKKKTSINLALFSPALVFVILAGICSLLSKPAALLYR